MTKKFYILFVALSLVCLSAYAVPAKRTAIEVTQPDGTTVTTYLKGDEHSHYQTTKDGYMLAMNSHGFLCYAKDSLGNITASSQIARNNRTTEDLQFLSSVNKSSLLNLASEKRMIKTQQKRANQETYNYSTNDFPATGNVKGLIIMVAFNDKAFSTKGTLAEYKNKMNQEGYSNYNGTGSARDYFIAQSAGKFTPTFDVVGPVKMKNAMSYYGGDVGGEGNDKAPHEMVKEACEGVKSQVNFADYDFNKDGYVDFVYIVYAGYGQAQGGASSTIWPHAAFLETDFGTNESFTINGVKISSYACSSELNGNSGTTLDGIGTFCHEFSHVLGLPDLYDTNNGGNFGMDAWSIMDYGCYNNEGITPCNYSAFERMSIGWIDIEELDSPQSNVSLPAMYGSDKAYIVKSSKDTEFYTLENRQKKGFDLYLPASGLMITHIDYDKNIWAQNTVNNVSSRQRVQIVPADNRLTGETLAGDTYPGSSKNTSFTDVSSPSATLATKAKLGKPITNIAYKDEVITFDFMAGSFVAPKALAATGIEKEKFTANWSSISDATSYELDVYSMVASVAKAASENKAYGFDNWKADKGEILSNIVDVYTDVKYCGEAAPSLKMNSTGLYVQTPLYSADISEFSFFIGASVAVSGSSLKVEGSSDGTTWNTIGIYSPTMNAGDKATVTNSEIGQIAAGTKALKVTFTKSTGNFAFDDLKIGLGGSSTKVFVPGYESKNVGNKLQETITGLQSDTEYFYQVRAVKDQTKSANSNLVTVKTNDLSGLDDANVQVVAVYTLGNDLIISSAKGGIKSEIYNTVGRLIDSRILEEGLTTVELPGGQVYIVKAGDQIFKIVK